MNSAHKLTKTHIALLYSENAPDAFANEFISEIKLEELNIEVVRKPDGPYAGIELYLPTIAIIYLAKSYFGPFLSEMGKDHYGVLKNAIKSLYRRLRPMTYSLIGSIGKVSSGSKYSMKLSMIVNADEGVSFKLLFEDGLDDIQLDETVEALLQFGEKLHAASLPKSIKEQIAQTRNVGGTILIAYDLRAGAVVAVDGVPVAQRPL